MWDVLYIKYAYCLNNGFIGNILTKCLVNFSAIRAIYKHSRDNVILHDNFETTQMYNNDYI